MPWSDFHPAVRAWFMGAFAGPTAAQRAAWPAIKSRRHTLIAAPTGSGKTLAAFLAVLDDLVWEGLDKDLFGLLEDRTYVLYVSPLRALSNDIRKNLESPLSGIQTQLRDQGWGEVPIRTAVRTGDTPAGERDRMRRKPPHILVTTPESLYILLTSDSGRQMLSSVRTVIVDEIHALAGNKRGAHLALSLERLQALCAGPVTRIGLSATQSPVEAVAKFLIGARDEPCAIVNSGHARQWDMQIELPGSSLEAVMSAEVWDEVATLLANRIEAHRTTLVFVNTRRLAERLAKALAERLGEDGVTAHHGSLAREHRLAAERRLKTGELKALVATASLELGIDIGDIDLVCQIGSPRAINTFLQRVGRSGHGIGRIPKGRLLPISRDDLVECAALLDAVNSGGLDALRIPHQALDVLAQQIVAEVSSREWEVGQLYGKFQCAWPYRELQWDQFQAVLAMLADGYATRRGRRGAWLHWDRVNQRLRPRRSARLVALLNGGTIPDLFDYDVILQPDGIFIGTLNEDFAFESLPGDIFQLGNTSYRILKTEQGKVHVQDAKGLPPNIPFWFGEAPGRSNELSEAVSGLRQEVDERLTQRSVEDVARDVERRLGVTPRAAREMVEYLASARAALQVLPTQARVVLERFFDEAGDQHLVIHSSFGVRVNRAWGLALRKRFCRKFNFELQAAALEDTIVLSLGPTHSFALEEVVGYLRSVSVRDLLTQALLDAPMFATHWRWNAGIALAIQRNRNGKRVPPQLQRMNAEDLLAVVFPDQLACLENIVGNREIPDHPLVEQTLYDCLYEVMDVEGLERVLAQIEAGEVQVVARDLVGPSPLAQEVLTARPYAFLDDAPAEERRTQMVQSRRFGVPDEAAILGSLDEEAIARVQREAWPQAGSADELHDALMLLGVLTDAEALGMAAGTGEQWLEDLVRQERVARLELPDGGRLWVCAERLGFVVAVHPNLLGSTQISPLATPAGLTREQALVELVRGRMQGTGPVTAAQIAPVIGVSAVEVETALATLESEGCVMRGRIRPEVREEEWCERGLMARIHRYTVQRLRREIQPVSQARFMQFLLHWHGLREIGPETSSSETEGEEGLARVLSQLEGYEIPAGLWESEVIPARLRSYDPLWLDRLCASGRYMWLRLRVPGRRRSGPGPWRTGPIRSTPVALIGRIRRPIWQSMAAKAEDPSEHAMRLLEWLKAQGASFFDELVMASGLLREQVSSGLAELAAMGLVSADSFSGLRALISSAGRLSSPRRSNGAVNGLDSAGRWVYVGPSEVSPITPAQATEYLARVMLRRYGVVFRSLLRRESQMPAWRDLVLVYRRLEDRGEVRGGRFVDGVSGEQFALPEAVGLLRNGHHNGSAETMIVVSAADPLNLVGVVLPGERIPALRGSRLVFQGGIPVAILVGGQINPIGSVDKKLLWLIQDALIRGASPIPHLSAGRR